MQALAIQNTAVIQGQGLNFGLFDSFISYIDRSRKTAETYITNLRQFAAWLNYRTIARPERQDIIDYRDYLTTEHEAIMLDAEDGWKYRTDGKGNRIVIACKPATVSLYLRSVKQFFKWTAAEGYYPNIADGIHAPKVSRDLHKRERLEVADVLAIEKSITASAADKEATAAIATKDTAGRMERATEQGKRLYAMYLLAVNAGLRTVELSRANVKDIESKGEQAYMYIWGKGHTEADQKKAIAPEVYQAVKEYLKSRTDHFNGNSPLFVATGNRSGGSRIDSKTISKMLKKAMRMAGYDSERLTAHSLRHTAGTEIMEISGNLYTTQKYMRHSDPATTEIYLHNSTEQQEASLARQLYARYHGKEEQNSRDRLEVLLNGMSMEQLEQMANIAAAMTAH